MWISVPIEYERDPIENYFSTWAIEHVPTELISYFLKAVVTRRHGSQEIFTPTWEGSL